MCRRTRMALDRVQSATAETGFGAPELLEVNIPCMYGGVDADAVSYPASRRVGRLKRAGVS